MAVALEKIITARLPLKVFEDLEMVAEERHRKRGAIIREAIEQYLGTWAEYRIAMDRLKDSNDKVLTQDEFLKDLGWDI